VQDDVRGKGARDAVEVAGRECDAQRVRVGRLVCDSQ
jgi:hypothetical protein